MDNIINKKKIVKYTFLAGIYIYAFGSHMGRAFISTGTGLIILAWLMKIIFMKDIDFNKDVKYWPIVGLSIVLILSTGAFWTSLGTGTTYSILLPLAILNLLEDEKTIYKVLIISLTILTISGFVANYQHLVEGVRRAEGFARFSITSANVSVMGIALLLPLLFKKNNKKWQYIVLSIMIFSYTTAAIFSLTRAAYIALIAVIFLFTLIKKPKIIILLLILMILIIFFAPSNYQSRFLSSFNLEDQWIQSRLVMWRASIDAVIENPVRGVGFKNYSEYFYNLDYTDRSRSSPHNNYFFFLASTGIPGFLIFVYLNYYLIKLFFTSYLELDEKENNLVKNIFLGITLFVISFLIMGLTETNITESQTRNFFWVVVGLGFSLRYLKLDKSRHDKKLKIR
ncbi:O-antigen ligase family protein [Halanaerobium sp. Z-7514]|uniref:O-antigen ligase family protein n=1 Tax=Halanaerobium polyolivorans TaxID=2886943 RepID=A0AAW4WT75_9FIRM|nr:O-antigen ligase family protein [Halanaerobium polyolivorans]MCC3144280.1 O-antigen ligase family protein [Halanaerobium polyolivorans]